MLYDKKRKKKKGNFYLQVYVHLFPQWSASNWKSVDDHGLVHNGTAQWWAITEQQQKNLQKDRLEKNKDHD